MRHSKMLRIKAWGLVFSCLALSGCLPSQEGYETQGLLIEPVYPATDLHDEMLAFCGFPGHDRDGGDVYLIRADGTDVALVSTHKEGTNDDGCFPAFNDVALGAYKREGIAWSAIGDILYWGIGATIRIYSASVSPDGIIGSPYPLWEDRWNGVFDVPSSPAPSPDNELLAIEAQAATFPGYQNVWIVNTNGSNPINVSKVRSFPIAALDPVWSPDGNWLAFAYTAPMTGIGIVDRNGSNPILLTDQEIPSVFNTLDFTDSILPANYAVSWYPDNDRLIFIAASTGRAYANTLFRYTISTSQLETLIESGVYSPVLSLDGTRIAYVQFDDETNPTTASLMLADADSHIIGELAQFSRDGGKAIIMRDIAWSFDGTRLAFSSNHNGDMDIYIIQADGIGLFNLTNQTGLEVMPRWRPQQQATDH